MTSDHTHQRQPHYQNPVFPQSFPDPFVLKYNGEYFAYCTGQWDDGRIFGVLHSTDLIDWRPLGGAMAELKEPVPFYWAPEVTYWNGTFYLYYSAGNEELMHLRVATSDRPDGGFVDSGRRLTAEDFAIDAHVFSDDDGQRYFFYATDFLEHSHIGTGVVIDRMADWFRLDGQPRPVVRAKYDWQVFDPNRAEKGGVRWHTVEGPFVLKRKGRYFLMFSGGNWKQPTYGVSFALSGSLSSAGEWRQFSDGEKILPILRTDENKQVGPGHNSVIRGPNNRELYCVYHYWHEDNRVLAVNRMDFAGPRIFVEDKPYLPKPLPLQPSARFYLESKNWKPTGSWEFSKNSARNKSFDPSSVRSGPLPASFLCEFSFKASSLSDRGRFGFRFEAGHDFLGGLVFYVKGEVVYYEWIEGKGIKHAGPMILGREFRIDALHHIRLEVDSSHLSIKLDDTYLSLKQPLTRVPKHLSLFTRKAEAVFSGMALTEGFEDCFESDTPETLSRRGWSVSTDTAHLSVRDHELIFTNPEKRDSVILRGEPHENFEFAVNIRVTGPAGKDASHGFVVLDETGEHATRLEFREMDGRFYLADNERSVMIELPSDFNPRLSHHFRFRKLNGSLVFDIETRPLGSMPVGANKAVIGIFAGNISVAFEMVRLTVVD